MSLFAQRRMNKEERGLRRSGLERGDLLGRQSAIVHQDLIHNSFNRSAAGASYT